MAASPVNFRKGAAIGANDGRPTLHGLKDRRPETFKSRRKEKHFAALIETVEVFIRDSARTNDPLRKFRLLIDLLLNDLDIMNGNHSRNRWREPIGRCSERRAKHVDLISPKPPIYPRMRESP